LFSGRNAWTAEADTLRFRFNTDSSSIYSSRELYGNGSAASSLNTASQTNLRAFGGVNANGSTSNTFGNASIYIPNYAGSTNKSVSIDSVTEHNGTVSTQILVAGLWASTASITAFQIFTTSQNLLQNSTASLYLITQGSGGATVS
jgi:hypothetical protein